MALKIIPKAVIERIPIYLKYLEKINSTTLTISSTQLASDLGLGEVQVRKDLNIIAGNGKPKIGYFVDDLKKKIKNLISNGSKTNVIIVGAGKIGTALANYHGFEQSGFIVRGIFDNDINKIGKTINGLTIKSVNDMKEFCTSQDVKLAVLAIPSSQAITTIDNLVKCNIKGILNFTNNKLVSNDLIKVRNVDIASLLMVLAIEINNY